MFEKSVENATLPMEHYIYENYLLLCVIFFHYHTNDKDLTVQGVDLKRINSRPKANANEQNKWLP